MIKKEDVYAAVKEADGTITAKEIAEKFGVKKAGVFMKMRKLMDEGLVEKVKPGVFQMVKTAPKENE